MGVWSGGAERQGSKGTGERGSRGAEGHALDRERELRYNLEHILNGR